MSRPVKIFTMIAAIVALLFIAGFYLRDIGTGHPRIDTAGEIAFVSDRGSPGDTHIWIMDSDGSHARELTSGDENDADPAFSPDGSLIAFASDRGGQPEIYVMDADGANIHAVTIGSDSKSDPQFSPDGTQLAYLTRGTLMTIDLSSNQTTPQLPSPSAATSTDAAALSQIAKAPVTRYWWQPSSAGKPQNGAIAAIQEPDTGDIQAATLLPQLGGNPKTLIAATQVSCAWSPDGNTLAMAALGFKGPGGRDISGLLLCNSDGKPLPPPLPLSPTPAVGPQNPAFKPDGTEIGFEVWQQPSIEKRKILGLGVAPVSGGGQMTVLVKGDATDIRFSPDGSHALFLKPNSADADNDDIWVMDPYGGSPTNLTDGQGDNTEPVWSPAAPKAAS